MDKKVVEWSHPEGSGQQLRVPMKISDKGVPQRSLLGLVLLIIFINDRKRD